jgi:hypothetical protein
MPRKLTGHYWTCVACGQGEDEYQSRSECRRALIAHTKRCRKCPPGHTVSENGQIIWRKP